MLPLILGTEIPSTLIRSTTAKIVRIVKNDDKLRGCNKDEYLREIFKLSKNIDLGNSATTTGSSNNTVDNHSVPILCNASTQTSCVSDCVELQKEVHVIVSACQYVYRHIAVNILTDVLKTGIRPACTLNMRVKLNSASPNYYIKCLSNIYHPS